MIGICTQSVLPVYSLCESPAPLVNQMLYGEWYHVLESRKHWVKIKHGLDGSIGWISIKQHYPLAENIHPPQTTSLNFVTDLISSIHKSDGTLLPIVLGSIAEHASLCGDPSPSVNQLPPKEISVVDNALKYVHAPELFGGRSPWGIDAGALTQMAYRLAGIHLKRTPLEQSTQGIALSFIEESEPGDLVFCDNKEGVIDHVGIMLPDHHVVHVYGKVRIDRIDHTGIFNPELRQYTHSLRVIKHIERT